MPPKFNQGDRVRVLPEAKVLPKVLGREGQVARVPVAMKQKTTTRDNVSGTTHEGATKTTYSYDVEFEFFGQKEVVENIDEGDLGLPA